MIVRHLLISYITGNTFFICKTHLIIPLHFYLALMMDYKSVFLPFLQHKEEIMYSCNYYLKADNRSCNFFYYNGHTMQYNFTVFT